jgi:hypothetical protein
MRHHLTLVGPLLAALLLGTGCGGDRDSGGSDPRSASSPVSSEAQGEQLVLTISGGVLGASPAVFTVPLREATMTRSMFSVAVSDANAISADGSRKLVRFNLRSNNIDEGTYTVNDDRSVFSAQFDVDSEAAGDGSNERSVRPMSGELVIERRRGGVLVGGFSGEGRSTQGATDDVYRVEVRFRTTYSTSMVPD